MDGKENLDLSLPPQPSWEGSIKHASYLFIKKEAKYSNKFGWSCYYRCTKFRAGCSANLILRSSSSVIEIPNGVHSCPSALTEKRKFESVSVLEVF